MKKKLKGFTLIELLVTVAILAVILTVVGYIALNVIGKSKEQVREISINNIESAAIYYAMENKSNSEWYDDYTGSGASLKENGSYACTTIQRLISKGFLDDNAVFPDGYDKDSFIVIRRDNFKTITGSSINPSETVSCSEYDNQDAVFTMETNEPDGLNGWYKQENLKGKISVTVGRSGIKEVEYYYNYDGKSTNIENKNISNNNQTSEVDFDINVNSSDIKVCAKVVNGLDRVFEECLDSKKIDHEIPETPVIVASDNKTSETWHNDSNLTLTIKQSVEKNFASGDLIYYLDDKDATTNVSSINLSNQETERTTYYGKICTKAGNCSNSVEYILKYDKTAPIISKLENSLTDYSTNVSYSGTFNDTLSGVSNWKIVTDGTYKDSGWTNISPTTIDITKSKSGLKIGTVYYLWVKDTAGNYSSMAINTKSISTGELDNSLYSNTISLDEVPINVKVFTDNGDASYTINEKSIDIVANNGVSSNSATQTTTSYKAASVSDKISGSYNVCDSSNPCPNGGSLSGTKCVGESYEKSGYWNDVTCKCSSDGYTSGCDNSSQGIPCNTGYTKTWSIVKKNIDDGQKCTALGQSFTTSAAWNFKLICTWNGDYGCKTKSVSYSSCKNGTTEYKSKCYSCTTGYEFSSGRCYKTVPKTIYKYNLLVSYSY